MTFEELVARAESAGNTVSWADLDRPGYWQASTATIWLDHSLHSRPRNAISVLAHELAHSLLGHEGPQPEHVEARCDVIAAGILISPTEYKLAEALHEGNPHSIAVELGVTTRIVRAYQSVLAFGRI